MDTAKEKQAQEKPVSSPTAEQIFRAATVTKRRPFDIEGAGRVWIHRLGHHEAVLLFDSMARDDKGKLDDPYDDAKVIARCVRDDRGKQIFTESDLPRIQAFGSDIFLGLTEACFTINGMNEAGREAIAKNSGTTLESDSGSE